MPSPAASPEHRGLGRLSGGCNPHFLQKTCHNPQQTALAEQLRSSLGGGTWFHLGVVEFQRSSGKKAVIL